LGVAVGHRHRLQKRSLGCWSPRNGFGHLFGQSAFDLDGAFGRSCPWLSLWSGEQPPSISGAFLLRFLGSSAGSGMVCLRVASNGARCRCLVSTRESCAWPDHQAAAAGRSPRRSGAALGGGWEAPALGSRKRLLQRASGGPCPAAESLEELRLAWPQLVRSPLVVPDVRFVVEVLDAGPRQCRCGGVWTMRRTGQVWILRARLGQVARWARKTTASPEQRPRVW